MNQRMPGTGHGHGEGLANDMLQFERLRLGRRRALTLIGAAGGAAVLGSLGSKALSTPGNCTVPSTETDGPYPADGTNSSPGPTSNALTTPGVERSDVRSSFAGASRAVAPGVATQVALTLLDAASGCTPLQGHAVYIWQCDRDGAYSLYNLPSESFLRGVQVTDARGQVTFTTIFPGCYPGRYPHIHFEVFSSLASATSGRNALLVSQLAMPRAQCDEVYATSGYEGSKAALARTFLERDGIFANNTAAQMAVMTLAMTGSPSAGYKASSTIGIAT